MRLKDLKQLSANWLSMLEGWTLISMVGLLHLLIALSFAHHWSLNFMHINSTKGTSPFCKGYYQEINKFFKRNLFTMLMSSCVIFWNPISAFLTTKLQWWKRSNFLFEERKIMVQTFLNECTINLIWKNKEILSLFKKQRFVIRCGS